MPTFNARHVPNLRDPDCDAVGYTLFVQGFSYSIGSLWHSRSAGTWKPSCLRRDAIALFQADCPTFTDRAEAFAWIRGTYEAALARSHALCAQAFAALLDGDGLSPVRAAVGPADSDVTRVLVHLIPHDTFRSIECEMTIQEALTALDSLSARAPLTASVVSQGRAGETERYPCTWTIPAGSNDYHLLGWRSLTGLGRYGRVVSAA